VPESFSTMPVVLPEYSSLLSSSVFSAEAGFEKASLWLDGVNMLYVAFTRAVDALYIMAPDKTDKADRPKANEQAGSVSLLLDNALRDGVQDASWNEDDNKRRLVLGLLPPVKHEVKEAALHLTEYAVSDHGSTMRLRTGGAMPLDDTRITEESGRIYGIVMHELLSRIKNITEIEKAVTNLADKGLVKPDEINTLTEKLKKLLSGEKVRQWFDGSSMVLNEATVLLPSGSARRPDRVMMDGDKVVVVDYKFGVPEKRHTLQAAEYKRVLNAMGYKDVEAYLWYLEKDVIELVS